MLLGRWMLVTAVLTVAERAGARRAGRAGRDKTVWRITSLEPLIISLEYCLGEESKLPMTRRRVKTRTKRQANQECRKLLDVVYDGSEGKMERDERSPLPGKTDTWMARLGRKHSEKPVGDDWVPTEEVVGECAEDAKMKGTRARNMARLEQVLRKAQNNRKRKEEKGFLRSNDIPSYRPTKTNPTKFLQDLEAKKTLKDAQELLLSLERAKEETPDQSEHTNTLDVQQEEGNVVMQQEKKVGKENKEETMISEDEEGNVVMQQEKKVGKENKEETMISEDEEGNVVMQQEKKVGKENKEEAMISEDEEGNVVMQQEKKVGKENKEEAMISEPNGSPEPSSDSEINSKTTILPVEAPDPLEIHTGLELDERKNNQDSILSVTEDSNVTNQKKEIKTENCLKESILKTKPDEKTGNGATVDAVESGNEGNSAEQVRHVRNFRGGAKGGEVDTVGGVEAEGRGEGTSTDVPCKENEESRDIHDIMRKFLHWAKGVQLEGTFV